MSKQMKFEMAVEREAGVIEKTILLSLRLSRQRMADYGHSRSRQDFTQPQLMACLVLRAMLKTTYRGVMDVLRGHEQLREVLGMDGKLPHYTTLQKFAQRKGVLEVADAIIGQIGQAALQMELAKGEQPSLAVDATGIETSTASAHYMARSGQMRKQWLKASVVITCATLFPLGVIFSQGPGSDKSVVGELFEKTLQFETPPEPIKLYADAGYDAEWLHGLLREEWEMESVIKPARTRADGTCGGRYRSEMTPEYLKSAHYGQRWQIESYFSALKRTMGSTLGARKEVTQHIETAFRILAYSLKKWRL